VTSQHVRFHPSVSFAWRTGGFFLERREYGRKNLDEVYLTGNTSERVQKAKERAFLIIPASPPDRHSRKFLAGIQVHANTLDPRQKHAGVTVEGTF
jgi:hypothetical protein